MTTVPDLPQGPKPKDEDAIRQEARNAGTQAAYEYLRLFNGFRTTSIEDEAQRLAQLAEARVLHQHGLLDLDKYPEAKAIFDEAQRIKDEVMRQILSQTGGYSGGQLSHFGDLSRKAHSKHLAKHGFGPKQ